MKRALFKLRPMLNGAVQKNSPDDFFIELNEPHKVFSPGDLVQGNVVLILPKDQKVAFISCQLRGEVTVRNQLVKGISNRYLLFEDEIDLWGESPQQHTSPSSSSLTTPTDPSAKQDQQNSPTSSNQHPVFSGNEIPSNSSSSNASTSMTSRASASSSSSRSADSVGLVPPKEIGVNVSSNDNLALVLQKGEHNFAFEFELPKKGLYNSLEFERGSISYTLTAACRKPSSVYEHTCKKSLSVVVPIDVARLPQAKITSLTVDVRKKRKQQGSIVVSVNIGQRGFLRGETVPVKISIQHIRSVKSLAGVVTTLSRISRMSGEGLEAQSFRKDLYQTVSPLYTDPATFACTITSNLRIPPETFPTTKGHKVISFQYCIEVVIDLEGRSALQQWGDSETGNHHVKHGHVDTDKLKRSKGVVCLWSEVVIGTSRSSRQGTEGFVPSPRISLSNSHGHISAAPSFSQSSSSGHPSGFRMARTLSSNSSVTGVESSHSASSSFQYRISGTQYDYEDVGNVQQESEKQRLQQMEQALLPSAPPDDDTQLPFYATAPAHPDDHPQPPYSEHPPEVGPSGSIPTIIVPPPAVHRATDDKQELERQRLKHLESMPSYLSDRTATGPAASTNSHSSTITAVPSAPPLPSNSSEDVAQLPSAPPLPPASSDATAQKPSAPIMPSSPDVSSTLTPSAPPMPALTTLDINDHNDDDIYS